MRNLNEMEVHRRLKGTGKSKPGDVSGTFDVFMAHNLHEPNRTAICKVVVKQGWECLTISIKRRVGKRLYERAPYPAEVARLLPLFFHSWEVPIQLHTMPARFDRPTRFLISVRSNQLLDFLPQF